LVLLNKIDLLPYVPFDLAQWHQDVERLNPDVKVLEVSAYTPTLNPWVAWLRKQVSARRKLAVKSA